MMEYLQTLPRAASNNNSIGSGSLLIVWEAATVSYSAVADDVEVYSDELHDKGHWFPLLGANNSTQTPVVLFVVSASPAQSASE